jgi:hypothetical protein
MWIIEVEVNIAMVLEVSKHMPLGKRAVVESREQKVQPLPRHAISAINGEGETAAKSAQSFFVFINI